MQQDSQQPNNSAAAPVWLLLFVGFIIGVCVGFVSKDMIVRAMIKVVPPMSGTTDTEPLPIPSIQKEDPATETPTTETPAVEVPAVDVPAVTPAPTGEGTPEEPKPEEEKPAEETAPADAAAPSAEVPPVPPAPPVL